MELILLVCLGPKKHNSAAHTRTETQMKDASIAGSMLAQIGMGRSTRWDSGKYI